MNVKIASEEKLRHEGPTNLHDLQSSSVHDTSWSTWLLRHYDFIIHSDGKERVKMILLQVQEMVRFLFVGCKKKKKVDEEYSRSAKTTTKIQKWIGKIKCLKLK